jgi:GH15 family glucan-1,4-alpha-glucosidase
MTHTIEVNHTKSPPGRIIERGPNGRIVQDFVPFLYDVYGRTNLREQLLRGWSGYRDSKPVRVGNNAVAQFQLDTHGQVIAAAQSFAAAGYPLNSVETQMLKRFGDVVCDTWREADNGIWEIPGQRRQYTFSKVMCWVALNGLLCLEDKGVLELGSRAARFHRERDELAQSIESHGFNTKFDSYVSELNGCDVDSALLLMACFGYRDAGHPRMISTYQRIENQLGRHGLIYRYRPGYDGLPGEQGAFGMCSFFAITHLAERGMIEEAQRSFERVCSFGNDLGLFGEEIEPDTGVSLGNFPQAFSHVGLIHAALSIDRARRRVAA